MAVIVVLSDTRLLTERKVVERRLNRKDPRPIHQPRSPP